MKTCKTCVERSDQFRMRIEKWVLLTLFPIALGGCVFLAQAQNQIQGEPDPTSSAPPSGDGRGHQRERRLILIKSGPEVKIIDNARFTGALYGVRSVRYVTFFKPLYFGGMAYGSLPGPIGEDLSPLFGYAGGLVGFEGKIVGGGNEDEVWPWWTGFAGRHPSWLGYDLALHVGLTRDLTNAGPNPLGRNLSLEPSASLSIPTPFFRGSRLAVSGGYLYLPFASDYSGLTIGLRIENKALETKVTIDD